MIALFIIAGLAVWCAVEHRKVTNLRGELEAERAVSKTLQEKVDAAESIYSVDDIETMRVVRKALENGAEMQRFTLGGTDNA